MVTSLLLKGVQTKAGWSYVTNNLMDPERISKVPSKSIIPLIKFKFSVRIPIIFPALKKLINNVIQQHSLKADPIYKEIQNVINIDLLLWLILTTAVFLLQIVKQQATIHSKVEETTNLKFLLLFVSSEAKYSQYIFLRPLDLHFLELC